MIEHDSPVIEPLESETRPMNRRSAPAPKAGDRARAAPPMTIPSGTLLINTYRIERLLGSGGMGEVYLARHVQLDTQHAVKVVRPTLVADQQVLDLFLREAAVLRGIRHDAIVSYDGFFRDEAGRSYLAMEYVDGPSLSERLKQGPLCLEAIFSLRDRLAGGLAEAHRRGTVHRDVSPDNVILPHGKIEHAKLIDFGLSKLTDPNQHTIVGSAFAGKWRYASPEQLGLFPGSIDARSDIYSFGLLLAAAATGRPLSMGESFYAVLQTRKSVPDLEAVPTQLRAQIGAMLQPDPTHRPHDIAEILRRWPAPSADAAPIPHGSERPSHQHPRPEAVVSGAEKRLAGSRWWLFPAAIAVATAIAGGTWIFRLREDAKPPPPPPIEQLAAQPWLETAPYFLDWVSRGQTDEAFALLAERVRLGQALPPDETYRFAQDLLSNGRLDNAFALFRVLAVSGDGASAFALAKMYDPVLWSATTSPFSRPNARQAEAWYRRALTQGIEEARSRLDALRDWTTDGAGGG